jgi:hypothetical protein
VSEAGNGERAAGHPQCWVAGLLDPEAAVVLTGPCLFWRLRLDHMVGVLGPLPPGRCRWTKALNPILCPCEATCSQNTALLEDCLQFPVQQTEVVGEPPQHLNGVFAGIGRFVQCLHNSLLGPCFPLSPSASGEVWAKLCALSPQCSTS